MTDFPAALGVSDARALRARLKLLALLSVFVAASCSSGGGTTDPDPTGSFTIALAEDQLYPGDSTLWIAPGESQAVTLVLTRTGGFAGAVTITVQGLPAGVTAVPLTIATATVEGLLTLNTTANAAVGVVTLTIRATAAGVPERTFPMAITVDPAGNPTQFALANTPNFLAIERGTAETTTVTVVPGSETRPITLTAAGLPAGVTASFSPIVITGGTPSTLTVTASAGATLGSAVIEIRGNTPGIALQTINLPIEIITAGSPPPGGPGSVTWDFCADSGIPIWVAFQQATDSGPWTRLTGTGDRYTFELGLHRGGIAWVLPNGQGGFELNVFYGTVAEFKSMGADRCGGNPGGGKAVTGTVTGFGGGQELALLRMGERSPDVAPSSVTPGFTFNNVRNGQVDLIGGLMTVGLGGTGAPSRFYIRRGLTPAAGALPFSVDFQGTDSFAPEVRNLTVQNHSGQALTTLTMLKTANAFGVIAANMAAPDSWYGVPAGRLQGGDLHLVSVTAVPAAFPWTRTVQHIVGAPAPLTVAFRSEPGTLTASRPTAKHPRLIIPLNFNTDYNRYWVADFQQSPNWRAQIQVTTGYRGSSAGNLRLEVPVLEGAAGWNPAWEPQAGPMTVTGSMTGWSGGAGITAPIWAAGNVFWSATRTEPVPDPPLN